jgi:hypothetical protein
MNYTTSLKKVDKPLVKSLNHTYSKKLLEYNGFTVTQKVGTLYKVAGFEHHNHLLDINRMFSNNPRYDPIDRTGFCLAPIHWAPVRPWKIPTHALDLEQAMRQRALDLCNTGQRLNLLWSGGIDSTAIVAAFLKNAPDIGQCRIIYSPWSTYEHPEFFKLLQNIPKLELIDTSGEYYFNLEFDGIMVSGNSGDESHASLDQSFFDQYGYDFLSTPWQDFFYKQNPDDAFIEFCQNYFALSGREIHTVLEARWWFYISSKLTSILNTNNLSLFVSQSAIFDPGRLIGFFDCDVYEQFIYFNTDKIILSQNYATWKQILKDYCHSYDKFDEWRITKSKFGSGQIQFYTWKKEILNNCRNLMILEDGECVSTKNLPLFSKKEWDQIQYQYQHVFRYPNTL